MPWETIGEPPSGHWPDDSEWVECQIRIAIDYLTLVCGNPPGNSKLGLTFREHELGEYPVLGLFWDDACPEQYLTQCQNIFGVFSKSVDWVHLLPKNMR